MSISVEELVRMSSAQIDDVFRSGEVGQIPEGEAEGTAIVAPGTPIEGPLAKLIHLFAWQGKVFDAREGVLRNKVLPLGLPAVMAQVYRDDSWFDGNPCIALDYSKTSLVAAHVRDEIRRVGPGLYLGLVFWDRTRLFYFTLQFPV